MPSFSGLNLSKSVGRVIGQASMRREKDESQCKVYRNRKKWLLQNKQLSRLSDTCLKKFQAAQKDDPAARFGTYLPKNLDDYPREKYGYFMHPEIISGVVDICISGFEKSKQDEAKKFAEEAVDHFRSVLRGEPYNPRMAIVGASMILKLEEEKKWKGRLPKELKDFVVNLCTAGSRVGIDGHLPLSKYGSAFANVSLANEGETGDVVMRKLQSGNSRNQKGVVLRTRRLDASQRTLGIFPKTPRGAKNISSRLSAAYKSIYYAASEAEGRLGIKPNCVVVEPLFGSDEDGSDIAKVAVPIALREALRAATFNSEIRIIFEGRKYSHKDFRSELAMQLFYAFPEELEKRMGEGNLGVLKSELALQLSSAFPEGLERRKEGRDLGLVRPSWPASKYKGIEDSSDSSLDASDEASAATRSVASNKATFTAESSSDKKTIVKPRRDASEENRSIGSRGSNSGTESDLSSYSDEGKANSTLRLPSSDGGGQATLRSGTSNSKGNGTIRVDPVHYKKPEIKLPPLSLSSDSESICIEKHVKKLVEKSSKGKKPSQKNDELSPGRKAKIRTTPARFAKAVRGFFRTEPVLEEVGKKVTFERDGVPVSPVRSDIPLTVSQFRSNGRLLEEGRPPQGAESEVSENAAQGSLGKSELLDFEEVTDLLLKNLDSLHDSWVNRSMESIDIPGLASGIVSFDSILNEFLSNIYRCESFPTEDQAAINGSIAWIETIRRHLGELLRSLQKISPGNNVRVKEAVSSFVRLMAQVINPSEDEATVQGQRRSVENDGRSIGNPKDVKNEGQVQRRTETTSVSESTGSGDLNRSRDRATPLKASAMASNVRKNWEKLTPVSKDDILKGLGRVIRSAGEDIDMISEKDVGIDFMESLRHHKEQLEKLHLDIGEVQIGGMNKFLEVLKAADKALKKMQALSGRSSPNTVATEQERILSGLKEKELF
jgi:hypothetical protein